MAQMLASHRGARCVAASPAARVQRPGLRRAPCVAPRAFFTQQVICASTGLMLAIGRYGFLPLQRRTNAEAQEVAGPKTSGNTFFDTLQEDASFLKASSGNDPDNFGIADVLGWGALGHALGFAVLAVTSQPGPP